MASSEDEGETVPSSVSGYELFVGKDDSISLAALPVEWDDCSQVSTGKVPKIFLQGKTDDGHRTLYVWVVAWKFDLSSKKPEISVKTREGNWIKLMKPRKAFEFISRSILVTLDFLHFLKHNPKKSQDALWDHLRKSLSTLETKPSESDLSDHLPLINEAARRDKELQKSQLLGVILAEKPQKRKTSNENVKPPFIVGNTDDDDELEADKSEEDDDELEADKSEEDDDEDEDDCSYSVCALCDDGGDLIFCEGRCKRSFHATMENGEESNCESLGFTEEEYEEIKTVDFYCKNCEYKQHQCFACGELGSSDESSGAEVFRCVDGACGHFYHPECVVALLHPGNKAEAEVHQQKIASGEQFLCPMHRCHVCGEIEERTVDAICRRCPRAYHRQCLPREIAFKKDVDERRAKIQRAWEKLIPHRILIYCLEHEIVEHLNTPARNHIKFPCPKPKPKRKLSPGLGKKDFFKERTCASEDISGNGVSAKVSKGVGILSSSSKRRDLSAKKVEKVPLHASSQRLKIASSRSSLVTSAKAERVRDGPEKTQDVKPTAKKIDNSLTLYAYSRERLLSLMRYASSSISLEDIKKKHEAPSTHFQYSKFASDNITLRKVEAAVQAVHAAVKKLEEGGSVEDAKAICGNDLLAQVMKKWKEKLKVYLAPFLHGMQYTSFGRHFTKVEKLKEIIDMLHWYVQDGDMIVDFCCGSNDFSCLVKEKLDEVGKDCFFKNFDIIQAKNDFNFERRDWMEVRPCELPEGSRLIMGLKPPFGFNCSLVNKFIDQALEFKPKLLILIVPRQTERLDEKSPPYDLIWQDDQLCNGNSFYLPGSVDVYDEQIEDWNNNPPVVSLWSRPDWTSKHKAIAEQHGHSSGGRKNHVLEETLPVPNSSQKGHNHDESSMNLVEKGYEEQEKQEPEIMASSSQNGGLNRDNGKEWYKKNLELGSNSEPSSKAFGGKRKRKGESKNISTEDKSSSRYLVPRHQSPTGGRLFEAAHSSGHLERASNGPGWMNNYQREDQGNLPAYPSSHQTEDDDELIRKDTQPSSFPGRQAYTACAIPDDSLRASTDGYAPPAGFHSQYALNPSASNPHPISTSAMQQYSSHLNDYHHNSGINMFPTPSPQNWAFAPPNPSFHHQSNRTGGWVDD